VRGFLLLLLLVVVVETRRWRLWVVGAMNAAARRVVLRNSVAVVEDSIMSERPVLAHRVFIAFLLLLLLGGLYRCLGGQWWVVDGVEEGRA